MKPRGHGLFSRYERKHEPLAPPSIFYLRLLRGIVFGLGVVAVALGVGILGYHLLGGLGWLDSLYNASMILSGMGPVDARPDVPAAEKWFASMYALFSAGAPPIVCGCS